METVNFDFMKFFDFLVKIAIFRVFLLFLGDLRHALLSLTLLYAGPCYHNTPLHTYYYHFNRNVSKELKIWWQFSIDSFCRLYQVYFHNSLLKIFEIWHGSKLVSLDYAQKRGKFNFFHFLCNKPYFFFLNLNFSWKMRSFEVHNVDVG